MSRFTLLIAVLASFAIPASASALTVPVQSLTGDFEASNSTVTKTPEGVHFGTYADGGAIGGTLRYNGFNGQPLSALSDFSYTFTYRQAGSTTGAAPYARIFLDSDSDGLADSDVILDPSFCATTTPDQATDLTFQVVGNSVRYNDDGCDGLPPDNQPYATVVALHGSDTIVGLLITQGFSTGTDVSALLRRITVNGTTYAFDVAPLDGVTGSQGPAGVAGQTGLQGQTVTKLTAPVVCNGDELRKINAPKRKGARFLSVRATLRGKRLKVNGRTINVDLTGQPEGNYNIRLTSRYSKNGSVQTIKTTRNLSVVCA